MCVCVLCVLCVCVCVCVCCVRERERERDYVCVCVCLESVTLISYNSRVMERVLSREEFTPHTKCKLLQRGGGGGGGGGGVIDVTRCEYSGHGSTFCFHVNISTFLGFTGGLRVDKKTSSRGTQQHPPTHPNKSCKNQRTDINGKRMHHANDKS